MSLKVEASKGVLWVAVERFGQQILQAVIFIILARLLTPEDFGLVAMLIIFFAISKSFIDSGMGQALIREKEITDQDRSTVFWFNLLLSFLFYGLLYISAPWIASFYERPELIELTRVMGLSIIFFGVAIVQRSEMTQQLEFKKQAFAQVPAVFIAGIVSISMAYIGFGVWSLVAQYLLFAFFSSVALWILQPAKILFSFNKESFDRLFSFGYKLLLSGLLATTYQHIYKLVIGKFFPASILGFYTQAKEMQQIVSQNLTSVIQKVSYPLLSKIADDKKRIKEGYRKVVQSTSFIIFPSMLILIFFAEPIMEYVLGVQWIPAAPFLQILCISGALYHLHAINLNVLKVFGRSDLFLKLEIIKKVNITLAILIGLQFGIYGLLIGQVISSYVALFINTWYTAKFLDYSISEQSVDVLKVLGLSVPMTVIVVSLTIIYPIHSLIMLIGYLFLSASIYLIGNLIYRTEIVQMVLEMAAPFLPKKIKTILHV
ncbi:lipopolysaccharide biosynthesis protein [Rhodohalobacter barkolensis]|uniref:Flippase n=1 Tax=Rhodohalobacter barkolensis TaxID=2053187 RepID=A0A2N0VKC6_9BACT|nr:lipopolysaccharide biosynthesis protein [Rhodohalobacter barkolensis]PKD44657.1 flippase [Rhodohalobacter barkolensis]